MGAPPSDSGACHERSQWFGPQSTTLGVPGLVGSSVERIKFSYRSRKENTVLSSPQGSLMRISSPSISQASEVPILLTARVRKRYLCLFCSPVTLEMIFFHHFYPTL